MKIIVKVSGDLNELMRSEYMAGERAVSSAVRSAGEALKLNWRSQVTGAGLGSRLANAIRAQSYPKGQPSLNAGALVWSKSPKIIDAHERGAVIRSANGFWLAIPLPAAGKGARGGRITPGQWEAKTGRRLTFIYRSGKSALLVDTGRAMERSRTMGRDGFSRAARGFKNRTVPVFALVPQVKLKKVLDLYPAAEKIAGGVPAAIVAQWRASK
jgi:hypothetical protein